MKIFKTILLLLIVSIFASIFMLSSCDSSASVSNIKIVDADDADADEMDMTKDNKLVKIVMFENRWYPSFIQLEQGDTVLLRIRNAGDHDVRFRLADFGIDELVPKGREAKVDFVSDKKGVFQITELMTEDGETQIRGRAVTE